MIAVAKVSVWAIATEAQLNIGILADLERGKTCYLLKLIATFID